MISIDELTELFAFTQQVPRTTPSHGIIIVGYRGNVTIFQYKLKEGI